MNSFLVTVPSRRHRASTSPVVAGSSTSPAPHAVSPDLVAEYGWKPGTHLENQVALRLTRSRLSAEQQHQLGRYRLDFAWPDVKIALEAAGWWHLSPEDATADRQRVSWLRSQGHSLRSHPDPYIRWPLSKHVPR